MSRIVILGQLGNPAWPTGEVELSELETTAPGLHFSLEGRASGYIAPSCRDVPSSGC